MVTMMVGSQCTYAAAPYASSRVMSDRTTKFCRYGCTFEVMRDGARAQRSMWDQAQPMMWPAPINHKAYYLRAVEYYQ